MVPDLSVLLVEAKAVPVIDPLIPDSIGGLDDRERLRAGVMSLLDESRDVGWVDLGSAHRPEGVIVHIRPMDRIDQTTEHLSPPLGLDLRRRELRSSAGESLLPAFQDDPTPSKLTEHLVLVPARQFQILLQFLGPLPQIREPLRSHRRRKLRVPVSAPDDARVHCLDGRYR